MRWKFQARKGRLNSRKNYAAEISGALLYADACNGVH
jgi:hypothetical protein